jgi:DNA-binding Xre family transcriptional regulator
MTELKKLAKERGMHYGHIADALGIKRIQVQQAATTERGYYKQIKEYLLSVEPVDVNLINEVMLKHDLPLSELSRMCNIHEERLSKIRNGYHVMYRSTESKLKSML